MIISAVCSLLKCSNYIWVIYSWGEKKKSTLEDYEIKGPGSFGEHCLVLYFLRLLLLLLFTSCKFVEHDFSLSYLSSAIGYLKTFPVQFFYHAFQFHNCTTEKNVICKQKITGHSVPILIRFLASLEVFFWVTRYHLVWLFSSCKLSVSLPSVTVAVSSWDTSSRAPCCTIPINTTTVSKAFWSQRITSCFMHSHSFLFRILLYCLYAIHGSETPSMGHLVQGWL